MPQLVMRCLARVRLGESEFCCAALANGFPRQPSRGRNTQVITVSVTFGALLRHDSCLTGKWRRDVAVADIKDCPPVIIKAGRFNDGNFCRLMNILVLQPSEACVMRLASGSARKSLADVVFDRVLNAIKSGAYRPDERLPTEHDLAAEFEVSRPIIREALRRLREQGLIYSRQGSGSYVRSVGLKQPLDFGQLENVGDLLNCYDFGLTLEPEAAAWAAERHTPQSLSRIHEALGPMRDATNRLSHRADADFQFHLAISLAADNNYFSTAMEALKDHMAVGMRFQGDSVRQDASGLTLILAEHTAIYAAISEGDGALARDLMRAHLASARERLFGRRRSET